MEVVLKKQINLTCPCGGDVGVECLPAEAEDPGLSPANSQMFLASGLRDTNLLFPLLLSLSFRFFLLTAR